MSLAIHHYHYFYIGRNFFGKIPRNHHIRRYSHASASIGVGTRSGSVSKQTTSAPQTVKSSAFTGKADYYEALFFLQDVLKRVQSISAPMAHRTPIPWYKQDVLADRLGFALSALEYRKIRQSLNALGQFLHVKEVAYFLQSFSPAPFSNVDREHNNTNGNEKAIFEGIVANRRPQLGKIDATGRAISVGRRKSASAKVFLTLVQGEKEGQLKSNDNNATIANPNDGQCWINGRPAIEYFSRPNEMFRLAEPWTATGMFGKFNAWCMVRGGGMTGQVGALVQALAKAIVLLAPNTRGVLRPMLRRDPRVVERKKPGQPKARKKFTWVKR